jgi:aminocarboxymuconate-semialdehyde decarboxylase
MPSNAANIRPYQSSAARPHPARYQRPDSLIVDIHGHMLTEGVDEEVRKHVPAANLDAVKYAPELTRKLNRKQNEERHEELVGIAKRLADMDRMCVDVMAVSPAPPQFHYGAPAALGHETAQKINDNIARAVKQAPDRLVGLATVPLQDTDLAIRELDRAIGALGMKGIEIGAKVGKDELSAERFEPFWSRCEALDVPILLHPTSFASDRFGAHYLTNIIGNPLDTTVAVHYLIFDGVLARHPDLKFVVVHGGAFVAAYAARMDHAWAQREDCCLHIDQPPTTYLKKMWFDTVVFANDQLEFLAKKYGADRIVLGTDYPFDMAEMDPTEHVMGIGSFSAADKSRICGLNSAGLLKIDPDGFARARPAGNWS